MNRFVLDTSVAAAWYLPERFTSEARSWQTQLLDRRIELIVPNLHYWEIGNVLRTYVRRGEISASLAREIYDLHLEAPLFIQEPDLAVVLATALEMDATTYDAVFISLCLALDVPLVTAERTTTPWVARLGEKVIGVGRS